jgi:hypothetical protein
MQAPLPVRASEPTRRPRASGSLGVVVADAEEVDADLVGEDAFDDVPNRLGMRLRATDPVVCPIAERAEPEDERELCGATSAFGLSTASKEPHSRQVTRTLASLKMARLGIEPRTPRFSVVCSTN